MIDVTEAIRTYMLLQAGIVAQVGTNVFGYQVPPNKVASMPTKCVCIMADSGPQIPLVPVLQWRVIFRCYGAEPGFVEAWEVARAVFDLFRRGGDEIIPVTGGNVYFYRSDCENAGYIVREPEVDWPRVDIAFSFVFSENVI